jgi:hypothetical protein
MFRAPSFTKVFFKSEATDFARAALSAAFEAREPQASV